MSEWQPDEAQREQLDALYGLKGKKQKAAAFELLDGPDGWELLAHLQDGEEAGP